MTPVEGPGLLFISLPVAFGQLQAGQVLSVLFFLFVGVAAITSAISLMEPMTAWLEQQFGFARITAAVAAVGVAWVLSLIVLFSFSYYSEFTLFNMKIFELLSTLTTFFLLPILALATMIFTGWLLTRRITQGELSLRVSFYYLWRFCLRYIVPLVIGLIFVTNLYNASF